VPPPTAPAAPAGRPAEADKAADRPAERQIESPSLPAIPSSPPVPAPTAPPSPGGPAPGGAPKGPVLIAPTAVTRTGGATPTIDSSKREGLPDVVAAKVCIDTAGRVSAVSLLTRLERDLSSELTTTIKGWTYTPYKQQGAAVPACFVVSFRAK
jgi:hypothetical protein